MIISNTTLYYNLNNVWCWLYDYDIFNEIFSMRVKETKEYDFITNLIKEYNFVVNDDKEYDLTIKTQ